MSLSYVKLYDNYIYCHDYLFFDLLAPEEESCNRENCVRLYVSDCSYIVSLCRFFTMVAPLSLQRSHTNFDRNQNSYVLVGI